MRIRVKPDPSIMDAAVESLSEADQDRLARILDEYLMDVAQGKPITPEKLLERHPADAEYLRGYLSGLELFHAVAAHDDRNSRRSPRQLGQRLGQVIGDYRLISEIGRGGMGVVYEAEQISLRRRVALKILPFTSAHDARHIERFKNEARAAAQVHHPNIVPVFAVGEDNGLHYYAMQLIGGQSLATVVSSRLDPKSDDCGTTAPNNTLTVDLLGTFESPGSNPRTNGQQKTILRPIAPRAPGELLQQAVTAADTLRRTRTVARLGSEAAAALHAAHEFGIVHRDVKPSNLLLDELGKIWVTDFGLARFRKNSALTQTGDVLGTMRYMSPEQALGRKPLIDHRTDIYSLGITLYELAALRHPAEGVVDAQIPFERARSSYKPLRHWNRHIPIDFQTIVTKAMGEFPHERYATAGEMADDLQRFLEGRPILASPPSVWSRASKWIKRHRGPLAAAAVVFFIAWFANFFLLTREKAATERANAGLQENLRETNEVLDRFSTRLVDQLAAVPGAEGVRQQLLEDSLGLYQRFLDRAAADPALAGELAAAYGQIGKLNEKIGNPSIALEQHDAALKIWEKRVAGQPANIDYLCGLASCENNIGLLLLDLGRGPDALKTLKQAERRLDEALLSQPDSLDLRAQAAATYGNLGAALRRLGSRDEAIAKFRHAIDLQEPLAAATPTHEAALRSLAANYNHLGSLYEAADGALAAQAYQQAISLQQELVKARRVNRIYQAELARTYNNLGYLFARRGDWKQAEVCYLDAIALQANLVKASPLVASYQRDLAISRNNYGMLQVRSAQPREAEASFREAIDMQSKILASRPDDVAALSNLGGVCNNFAMLLDEQGRANDAEQAWTRAIDFQKHAFELAPNAESIRGLLNKHYVNYAKYLRQHNRPTEAIRIALQRKPLGPNEPDRLLAIGQELAADYQLLLRENGRFNVQKECADAAISTLREAVAAGLSLPRLKVPALAPLQELAGFQQLVAGARTDQMASDGTTPTSNHETK